MGDCDDNDSINFPGNPEVCDGLDNDCTGVADDGLDQDMDGVTVCDGDCDDQESTVFPTSIEVCDGLDNNCDTVVDEGFDLDLDGVTTCGGDCNDANPDIYIGAPEPCEALDYDCDGVNGDVDADLDSFAGCDGDCDDTDPAVWPGAPLIACDGTDYDCDGSTDETVVVGVLPSQSNVAGLPGLADLAAESVAYGCTMSFVDIPAVTEADIDASGAQVLLLSSPGEDCAAAVQYDPSAWSELDSWLFDGKGIVITGHFGTDACLSYAERAATAEFVGITLSATNAGLAVGTSIEDVGGTFWTGITSSPFVSTADMTGDDIAGTCTNGVVEATVDVTRSVVAFSPGIACTTAFAEHRGAWIPYQPEDGGGIDDRRLLYNVLEWIKSVP
jgi:hypothetical protein